MVLNTVCTYVCALQQLPVTIPKLAQLSPCQSSDGKIYTGVCVCVCVCVCMTARVSTCVHFKLCGGMCYM